MTEPLLIFLAGLAGSMHCIGMCGGFACGLGADARGPAASVLRHLVYNLGRVTSYCFLGAVVGHLGLLLVGHGGEGSGASTAQRALAVLSGTLMVFIGLQFFGVFRGAGHGLLGEGGQWLAQALRQLVRAPGVAAPLALGVLNGFLPCPLVYAFAAQAAASGGPLAGLQIMAAFGLGTFPAMLAMGGIGLWWRRGGRAPVARPVRLSFVPRLTASLPQAVPESFVPSPASSPTRVVPIGWRVHGVRVAGGFIVMLGLVTLARGLLPMSAHLH